MAMGPRLNPFPWEQVCLNANQPSTNINLDGQALFGDPNNDGVQLNINLGGYAPSWTHLNARYAPSGMFMLSDMPYYQGGGLFDIAYATCGPKTGDPWLTQPDTSPYIWDSWHLLPMGRDIPFNTAMERYFTSDYTDGITPIVPGLRRYPGVASSSAYGGISNYPASPVYMGYPVWYETWFSENETRSSPTIGYNGYTMFSGSTRGQYVINSILTDVPGAWIRRFVYGIMRTGANLATCSPTDIMCGCIVVGDGNSTTAYLCVNGTVVYTDTMAHKAVGANINLDLSLAQHYTSALNEYMGGCNDLYVEVYAAGMAAFLDSGNGYNTSYSVYETTPPSPLLYGIDTYDVKFGWYADIPSSAPVGVPYIDTYGYPVQFWPEEYTMYTHPGWTVPLPTYNSNVPSSIASTPTNINNITSPNNYQLHTGNVYTNHINITSSGEILINGNAGVVGDLLISSGAALPIRWDHSLETKLADAEYRVSQLVPSAVNVILTGPISGNRGEQIILTSTPQGGVSPYSYSYEVTSGEAVTIPPVASPTITLPVDYPGAPDYDMVITVTITDAAAHTGQDAIAVHVISFVDPRYMLDTFYGYGSLSLHQSDNRNNWTTDGGYVLNNGVIMPTESVGTGAFVSKSITTPVLDCTVTITIIR